jgi:ActR/RegA family two-component response regulator
MQRFLLVDNAAAVRMTLEAQLGVVCGKNIAVEHAQTGAEALAACKKTKFDAVLIGMGLANEERGAPVVVKLLEEHPDLAIIVCTSMPATHRDVTDSLSAGAVAYLAKPTRADTVRKALEGVPRIGGNLRRIR